MKLTRRTVIKPSNPHYKNLLHLCRLSKNLYNTSLYTLRQHYKETESYLSYVKLDKLFKETSNPDYRALPTQTAQQTMRIVDSTYRSFFDSIKKGLKSRIPKYLDKEGYFIVIYTRQELSEKALRQGIIKLPKSDIELETDTSNINQVRFVPKKNMIVMEVVYEKNEPPLREDRNRKAAIDIGIDNLMTLASNVFKPVIINGKPLKSINQYYNKKKSQMQSILGDNKHASNRIQRLTLKRNNKVKDYMHKATAYVVNQILDSNSIDTLVIGYNKGWKQDTDMGRNNNQNFVCLPHSTLISMLKYKARLKGIKVIVIDEAYTSKASFFDNDIIPSKGASKKKMSFSGKRIKRGLYRTKNGWLVNADVNGALNILRKSQNVACDEIVFPASRGFVSNPVRISII